MLSTYLPRFMGTYLDLNRLGKAGLTATLLPDRNLDLEQKLFRPSGSSLSFKGSSSGSSLVQRPLVAIYTGFISI